MNHLCTKDKVENSFVAYHVSALGGLDKVDKTHPYLASIVNQFLPDHFSLIEIVEARRELVAGVKYEVIFRALDKENNDEISCFTTILEKPWLQRNSQKYREMIFSNCSIPFVASLPESSFSPNPTFENKRTEMSSGEMKDLEQQILSNDSTTEKSSSATQTVKLEEIDVETTTETIKSAENLDPSSKNMLDDFFNLKNYIERKTTTETPVTEKPLSGFSMDALDNLFGIKKEVKEEKFTANRGFSNVNASPTERTTSGESNSNSESKEKSHENFALNLLELEVKRTFSELFQNNPEFQRAITELINENNEQIKQEKYNYVFNILMRNLKEKLEKLSNHKVSDEKEPSVIQTSQSPEHHHSKRSLEKEEIWRISNSALSQLDRYDEDETKRVVLNIINVKMTNINNQTRLLITLNVANSLCKENDDNCEKEIDNLSSKMCTFEVIYCYMFSEILKIIIAL
jgi:cathepsin F